MSQLTTHLTYMGLINDSLFNTSTSDDINGSLCEPCIRARKWTTARGYCQNCEEFLCMDCLTVHNNLRLTRSHTILDKHQTPIQRENISTSDICVQICKAHRPEIIKYFCKDHEVPGCTDCMTLNHTSCTKCRIQDVSVGFTETNEFKSVKESLNILLDQLKRMKKDLKENVETMDEMFENVKKEIASLRLLISQHLDMIEEDVTDKVTEVKKKEEAKLKKLVAENEAMTSELAEMLRTIEDASVDNVNSIFVTSKIAKLRMVEMKNDLKRIRKLVSLKTYKFCPSDEIESLLSANTRLGQLTFEFSYSWIENINIKSEASKVNCLLVDSVLLGSDRLVFSDGCNNMILSVDLENHSIVSRYSTSSQPRGITALSQTQVAVTLPAEQKIAVVQIVPTNTILHNIQVSCSYYGISYKNGMFAASRINPGRIDVLNMDGTVLHEIVDTNVKDLTLERPIFVTFGADYESIIVSDFSTNKVSIITFEGQILHSYTHDDLIGPCKVLLTTGGVLLVCARGSDSIHVLSRDLRQRAIIRDGLNIVNPRGLSYCDIRRKLYICNDTVGGGDRNNIVHVCNVGL
ncbi:hypothetical protein ACF0H5_010987 [Mactra antiquata]